jgi:hypothetical protein
LRRYIKATVTIVPEEASASALGKAVQVDPMKPKLTARLELSACNLIVIKTAFNFCFQFQFAPLQLGQDPDPQQKKKANLDEGNLAGSIHAALDVASSASSVRSLPPLGGWATAALNFWASGGDLMGRFQTSSFSVSGVLDSRLGDPDRPYARIVAPVVAELPCFGVLPTVGSIFANIDGVFRLHAENIPMNISCGDSGDAEGERPPDLVASADLTLVIEPPDEFNKLMFGAQAKANEMINAAKNALRDQIGTGSGAESAVNAASPPPISADDAAILKAATQMSQMDDNSLKYDGRFTIPFMKTINVKARHVRGPAGWYWDGALDATIGGAHSPLRLSANATFKTKEGFPPDAQLGVTLTYTHESLDLYAAGSFPVGACYDPYRFYGKLNIHPPDSVVSNASFNASLMQYCQKDDGTTVGRCMLLVSTPVLKAPMVSAKLYYDKQFSTFAFNFNLRRHATDYFFTAQIADWVGRCRLTVFSKPVLKAPVFLALETRISSPAVNFGFQYHLAPLQVGHRARQVRDPARAGGGDFRAAWQRGGIQILEASHRGRDRDPGRVRRRHP